MPASLSWSFSWPVVELLRGSCGASGTRAQLYVEESAGGLGGGWWVLPTVLFPSSACWSPCRPCPLLPSAVLAGCHMALSQPIFLRLGLVAFVQQGFPGEAHLCGSFSVLRCADGPRSGDLVILGYLLRAPLPSQHLARCQALRLMRPTAPQIPLALRCSCTPKVLCGAHTCLLFSRPLPLSIRDCHALHGPEAPSAWLWEGSRCARDAVHTEVPTEGQRGRAQGRGPGEPKCTGRWIWPPQVREAA